MIPIQLNYIFIPTMLHLTPLAGKTDPIVLSTVESFDYNQPEWHVYDGDYEAVFKLTGEVRYGPAYGEITLKHKGETIWQAANCAADCFGINMLSARYGKAVVAYWPNGIEPDTQTLQVIDLATGAPTFTLPDSNYYSTGHCISFDAVYYTTGSTQGVVCRHLQTGLQFNLLQNIHSQVHKAKTWSVCNVPDCVVAYGRSFNNLEVYLYNTFTQQVIDSAHYELNLPTHATFLPYLDKATGNIVLYISYGVQGENGHHLRTDSYYYLLSM